MDGWMDGWIISASQINKTKTKQARMIRFAPTASSEIEVLEKERKGDRCRLPWLYGVFRCMRVRVESERGGVV